MNVLHLINYAGNGGTEKYINILIDNLEEVNFSLCYNNNGLLVDECRRRNLKIHNLCMNGAFDMRAARKLANIVKDDEIDIVHTHYLRENYIAILAKIFGMKAKIVYTCHFNQIDTLKVAVLNKFFYNGLDRIIAIANVVKESLIKSGAPKKKIKVIYHGVKKEAEFAPNDIAHKKYVKDDTFVISCASRFSSEKGNEFLIKSFQRLLEICDRKVKLILANDGVTCVECKKLVKELGLENYVEFIGYISEGIDNLYLASDLYVTPSKTEGLGLAVLESMKYGLPNVATDAGGLAEIISEKNDCGITVKYGDIDGFAKAMKKMIIDDEYREHCKLNAKKAISNTFDLERMLEHTYNIYKEVLEEEKDGSFKKDNK